MPRRRQDGAIRGSGARGQRARKAPWLGLALSGALACAGPSGAPPGAPDAGSTPGWDLFVPDGSDEALPGAVFAPRIRLWQASERLEASRRRLEELDGRPAPELDSRLAGAHAAFQGELREQIVARTLAWVQAQSRSGYRRDPHGDSWPILQDLLERGRDDCDGWELLTFSTLRRFGFGPGAIYRAVLRRREPESYHMVTLWRPGPGEVDPWVLDPIGSIARRPVRLSTLGGWEPVRIFDEAEQFGAVRTGSGAPDAPGARPGSR